MVLNKENRAGFFVVVNTKNKKKETKTISSEIFLSKEQANRVLFTNLIVILKKLLKDVKNTHFSYFLKLKKVAKKYLKEQTASVQEAEENTKNRNSSKIFLPFLFHF